MIYYGHIHNRKELELIVGDLLPNQAKVWFVQMLRQPTGHKNSTYNMVCYYSQNKMFYAIAGVRSIFGREATAWHHQSFMFNSTTTDARQHISTELDRMRRVREETQTKKTVWEAALELMVMQDEAWRMGHDEIEFDPEKDTTHGEAPEPDILPPARAN